MHEVCHVIFDAAILFAGKPCSRADVELKFKKLVTNVYHERAIETIKCHFDGAYHLVAGLARLPRALLTSQRTHHAEIKAFVIDKIENPLSRVDIIVSRRCCHGIPPDEGPMMGCNGLFHALPNTTVRDDAILAIYFAFPGACPDQRATVVTSCF